MRLPAELPTLWRRGACLLLLGLLCAAGLAHAQDDNDGGAPPDRVARLSYIAGDLGFLPAGSQDWADADINRPLTTGDRLATGYDARAELELGGAALRLDDNTDVGLLNLNDNLAQAELTHGSLNLSVRHLEQGQSVEIDTPTLALVVNQPGRFRIDVDNDGSGTRVTVLDGRATVYGENNAQHDVFAGRSYQFDDASLAALTVSELDGGDAFDAWCNERDQRYAQSTTRRYVSTEVVGYQDLDDYGDWRSSADYGAVWYPSQVPAGWAPYRDGHWAYIAPWGWTWVDAAPWGFAPYHYGRWAWIGGAWGWVPGPVVARPVYAPALVAFVGGGGWSVSVGFGAAPVGWFPLGPGEVYNPWYHCDRAYYQRVNVTNIYVRNTINRTTVINHIDNQYNFYRDGRTPGNLHYANRTAPQGFSAMPGSAFASGRRVRQDLLRVDPRRLAAATVLPHGVTALQPDAGSLAPRRSPQARPLPVADFRRRVVARTPPPAMLPATRQPFTTQPSRQPIRADRPFANVRVLNGHDAPPSEAMARDRSSAAAPRITRPEAPAERRAPPAMGDALPSARFAHPQAERLPMVEPLRPAAPPAELRRRASPDEPRAEAIDRHGETLPQPPRFEQAPPAANPSPREPAYRPPRAEPQREPMARPYEPMREAPPARFERADNPPRPIPREYARPIERPQPYHEAPRPAEPPRHAEPRRKPVPEHDEAQR